MAQQSPGSPVPHRPSRGGVRVAHESMRTVTPRVLPFIR
ncbi:hypothetical protein Ae168Ps1_3375c [Pseudonocardia sp. Ae168_Ps1]|nr:hypothetical protein Ae150APs1_3356c [Pseudonocardia sp. Ae150A_Ps1]OLL80969.1 hypothetical protein Ae168Ps1_3375c [Pseudonocardia sp. Ae168_Ps1]OLL84913.1 hypothetical protein Ae263Ps1_1968 [Pseudonocardia sp. Ae263_Ps1]OLL95070.1 hypothetical protein Ae356Ps1_4967c [Pseudonocardia sp. Ae356_Ps1]